MKDLGGYELYIKIGLLLMVLTVITVGAAQFDFGPLNVPIALLIASVNGETYPIFLLFLLISFSATDIFTRLLN